MTGRYEIEIKVEYENLVSMMDQEPFDGSTVVVRVHGGDLVNVWAEAVHQLPLVVYRALEDAFDAVKS